MIAIFKSVADLQLKDSFWINVKPLMVGFGFNFLLLWKSNSKAEEKYFKIKYWFSLSSDRIKKSKWKSAAFKFNYRGFPFLWKTETSNAEGKERGKMYPWRVSSWHLIYT